MIHQKTARILSRCVAAIAISVSPFFAAAAEAPAKPATKPATAQAAKPAPKPDDWKLLDGWKVEVLAEHPTIHFPSVVCCAPDGRIFVAEDPMDMRGSSKDPADRILVYHPETKKFTVFADKLFAVFGMQYIDGKLYVHHTPKFSVFTDKDSVGVDRKDLISCDNPAPNLNGTGFNDHIPSNCRLAMDGYIYITTGDKGIYNAESAVDHSKATIHGGGIYRIRPDGTGLEVYATGTRNHLDVAINSEDEMFTYDNTDDGLGWWTRFTHMVEGGYYGYPYDYRPPEIDKDAMNAWNAERDAAGKAHAEWEKVNKDKPADKKTPPPAEPYSKPYKPWTLWRMEEYGAGSPTGSVAYNEDALPAEYRGNIFASEWGKGQVERFAVKRDGGTYKIVKHDVVLKGGPGQLRPVGIQVLDDGSGIVVADWNYAGWRNGSVDTGRLLKITFTGKLSAAPKPAWYVPAAEGKKFEATNQELIAALSHPAESVRLVAQRRLIDRGHDVVPALIQLLQTKDAPQRARWHAIWTLDAIDAAKPDPEIHMAIIDLLTKRTVPPAVRIQAARELGTRKVEAALSPLLDCLSANNAALRFHAATALARIASPESVETLLDKLDEKDLFVHYAIFRALNQIAVAHPETWDSIVAALASDRTEQREGALLAMHETYDLALVKKLAAFAASTKPADYRASAITAMAPLFKQVKPWQPTAEDLKWWKTMPARDPAPPKDVEWAGTKPVAEAIRVALDDQSSIVRHAAVQALRVAPDPTVADRLTRMYESDHDLATRRTILEALASAKAPATAKFVQEIFADPKRDPTLVTTAIEVAERVGGAEMTAHLVSFLDAPNAKPEQIVEALKSLTKLPDPRSIPRLIEKLDDKSNDVVHAAGSALGAIHDDHAADAVIPFLKGHRPDVRRAAANALAGIKSEHAIFSLIAVWQDHDVQREAILALAARPDVRAVDAYIEGVGSNEGALRGRCRHAIEEIHEKALPLIEARLETNPPSARAVAEIQRAYEKFIPAEKRKTQKLFQFDTHTLTPEAFETYVKSHGGDVENGKKIFHDANGVGCIKCHKVANEGGDVGPSLDGVGTKYPKQFLLESILYPSKQILDGYQQTVIKRKSTKTSDYYIVRAENETELTAVDSTGQKTVIKKDDVLSRKMSPVSMMPEGLQAALKPEELADVVAYLESLKAAKK